MVCVGVSAEQVLLGSINQSINKGALNLCGAKP
jgi:hypothetical protein